MKPWPGFESDDPLEELVNVSRLVGSDPSLVLHSGGNSSIKTTLSDIYGQERPALYIKGSGTALATMDRQGFAAVDLEMVRRLLSLAELSDADMVNQLNRAKLDAAAPNPSLETILHAFLEHRVVLHTHADAFLAISNTPNSRAVFDELYGDSVVHAPYSRPGLPLALACARSWKRQSKPETTALLLERHGVFTFGSTAKEAYERMATVVETAEQYLASNATSLSEPKTRVVKRSVEPAKLAKLRAEASDAAGQPLIMTSERSALVAEFMASDNLAAIVGRGPVTPDHVIRTKPWPLIGTDVAGYRSRYESYFESHSVAQPEQSLTMLDPAPRIILDDEFGLLGLGDNYGAARIAKDVYLHSMETMALAESLGGFSPVSAEELFEIEYWSLEQAKVKALVTLPELAGQVAVVTGAASGIGKACASALLEAGAAVCGLDLNPGVTSTFDHPSWLGLAVDVSDPEQMEAGIGSVVDLFGGIDIAVVGAGIFGASTPISDLAMDEWRKVMSINVDSVLGLFGLLHPIMAQSPVHGRVVVIGSKNVPAPGKGAAAYSTSKAALVQLCRIAALEWADDGIRVNMVHPDAVFDTGLWTPELLAERADKYGLTVAEYKRRNLLSTEVSSAAVAALMLDMCGPGFAATTGAQVPIDGGSDRVI